MTTPSVTLRSLKNADTGIDISVPRFQEEEAPLGGISVLYEISVLTTLQLFKTRLHRDEDVVHFSIFKAYREIEDLSNKLNKKYPKAGLPPVPKASTADKYTCEEKLEALDIFMSAVAKNIEICHSSMFTQFIGINSQRLPSFNIPSTQSVNTTSASKSVSSESNEQEVFPKMKNVDKNQNKFGESVPESTKKVYLFEESNTSESKAKTNINAKSATSQGLFDEFDDDSLFSSKPTQKKQMQPKHNDKKADLKKAEPSVPRKQVAKTVPDKIDDSEIIIKDRKFGDVSLFEEQDFGDYITKEEEALFLVTEPTKTKQNFLLSKNNEILSPAKDVDVNDNLDDLLDLSPLPISPVAEKPENVDSKVQAGNDAEDTDSKVKDGNNAVELDSEAPVKPGNDAGETDSKVPPKPVPQPRKKSLSKTEPVILQKPEVMPRKVFLNKNGVLPEPSTTTPPTVPPKPTLPSPGTVQAKPKPPVKPKPPPKKPNIHRDNETKTADLDQKNGNKPEANDNIQSTGKSLADELKELDILKYIEQEEKSLDSNLSLFD